MALAVFDGIDLAEVSMKAHALALQHRPKLPEGADMLPLYRPMHFSKKRLGRYSIKTKKATGEQPHCLDVVNMRYAVLLGLKPMRVTFPAHVKFNWLYRDGKDVVTSDTPAEIYQQYISFSKAHGHVLVGGLGLGMCAEMMLKFRAVKSVTVVEKDPQVIDLVQPQIDKRIKVVHADLYEFLGKLSTFARATACDCRFDFAYYDIWYSCGESTWASYVVPLYRMSRAAGIKDLGAWGEWEMQAQLVSALYTRAMVPAEARAWKPYKVFIDACSKAFGHAPPFTESRMPMVGKLIDLYLNHIGSPKWEQVFDWGPNETPEED